TKASFPTNFSIAWLYGIRSSPLRAASAVADQMELRSIPSLSGNASARWTTSREAPSDAATRRTIRLSIGSLCRSQRLFQTPVRKFRVSHFRLCVQTLTRLQVTKCRHLGRDIGEVADLGKIAPGNHSSQPRDRDRRRGS